MTVNLCSKSSKIETSSEQITSDLPKRQSGLENLPADLLLKIAAFAIEPIKKPWPVPQEHNNNFLAKYVPVNLRLCCKKIDKAIREAVISASYSCSFSHFKTDLKHQELFPFSKFRFPNISKLHYHVFYRKIKLGLPTNNLFNYSKSRELSIEKGEDIDSLIKRHKFTICLERFSLARCERGSNQSWHNLFKRLHNLQNLVLLPSNPICPGIYLSPLSKLTLVRINLSESLTNSRLNLLLDNTPNLLEFSLSNCPQISGEAFSGIVLRKLRGLYMEDMVTLSLPLDFVSFLLFLCQCGELENLEVRNWDSKPSTQPFKSLIANVQPLNLKNVYLNYAHLSEWGYLFQIANQLESLKLIECFSSGFMEKSFALKLSNLKHIEIDGCYDLTNQIIESLIGKTPFLERLRIDLCPNLPIQWINRVDLSQIRSLFLRNQNENIHFSAQDICSIARKSPHLQRLKLGSVRNEFRTDDFGDLRGAFENLKELYLQELLITDEAVLKLLAHMDQLENITFD